MSERDEAAGGGGAGGARLDAVVVGRVQGVGFRAFVLDVAHELELAGWVRNEPDGSVRCVAEGPRPLLEELEARLREGPWGARVERVVATWTAPFGEAPGFRIRSGGHSGD